MDITKFKFSSDFFSSANVLVPEDHNEFFAKASLADLRGLLPKDINPATSPDLLYFAANGAIAGMCNANGDSITVETALEILPLTKNKYINVDHKKDKVVGVLLESGASKFGDSTLITLEQAAKEEIFNLACAGAVWRPLNKDLVSLLVESSDFSSVNYHKVSLSWEIFFNNYDIAVGSKLIKDAKIITDDVEKQQYEKYLKKNGGSGECSEGSVYRVIKNTNGKEAPNVIIGGYSFVINPAAAVKGIEILAEGNLTISNKTDSSKAAKDWELFTAESGTLGIPRSEMPQIKSVYRGALIQFLKSKGVDYTKENISTLSLKPTQAEYSPEKVEMAKTYLDNDRSILVSSDNYIIDGHHQWLAAVENKFSEISIIRFSATVRDLIDIVKTFPSMEVSQETASIIDNTISQLEKTSVTELNNNLSTFNIMDIKTTSDIQSNWDAISKMESQAGVDLVVKTIRDEIAKASEDWCEKAKCEKAAAEQAKAELADALKSVAEIKEQFAKAQCDMEEMKKAEQARAASEVYNERMAEIECEFELDSEDLPIVAAKIKDMNEESYAAFRKEFAVIAKEKCKAFKAAKAAEMEKQMAAKMAAVASTITKSKEELVTEALAGATATEQTLLTPGLEPASDVFAKYKQGFASGIKTK